MKRKLFFGLVIGAICMLALGGLTVRGSRRAFRIALRPVLPRPRPAAPAYA